MLINKAIVVVAKLEDDAREVHMNTKFLEWMEEPNESLKNKFVVSKIGTATHEYKETTTICISPVRM